jgi:hypothetical protein
MGRRTDAKAGFQRIVEFTDGEAGHDEIIEANVVHAMKAESGRQNRAGRSTPRSTASFERRLLKSTGSPG